VPLLNSAITKLLLVPKYSDPSFPIAIDEFTGDPASYAHNMDASPTMGIPNE
jgi:hypothetical protein